MNKNSLALRGCYDLDRYHHSSPSCYFVFQKVSTTEMPGKFKNGAYKSNKTGAVYYMRLRQDGVWVYRGKRATFAAYCGVFPVEYITANYTKV